MAVTLDLTENNVHFRKKRPAGERLAAIALAQSYGRGNAFSGPVCDSFQKEGREIRVKFRHTDGGLVARELPDVYVPDTASPGKTLPLARPSPGSALQGFLICGADRNWQCASARIDGDDVVVWSENVADPVAVRYAWADNPVCNLFNGAGFPASPFRTDGFPGVNDGARYTGKPY
jgi:sialate O-acetylesterase